jgi:hypothetical protein
MGQAGRERVQAVLAWEHSAPVLLAAYDRLWLSPDADHVIDLDQHSPDQAAPSQTSP